MGSWGSRTTSDLVGFLEGSMPPGNPGGLGEETYVNMVAFILDSNGARAGNQPLTRGNEDRDPLSRDGPGARSSRKPAAAAVAAAAVALPMEVAAGRTRGSPRSADTAGHHRCRAKSKTTRRSPTPCCAIPIPATGS